ncbi:MAG: coat protein [Cressdnaviricota sp.]|nr:MAG: coat protein [Cressdnaviricota sp.]
MLPQNYNHEEWETFDGPEALKRSVLYTQEPDMNEFVIGDTFTLGYNTNHFSLLNPIQQGTNEHQRIGDHVNVLFLGLSITMTTEFFGIGLTNVSGESRFRHILFIDHQPKGITFPDIQDILDADEIGSWYKNGSVGARYQILWDDHDTLNPGLPILTRYQTDTTENTTDNTTKTIGGIHTATLIMSAPLGAGTIEGPVTVLDTSTSTGTLSSTGMGITTSLEWYQEERQIVKRIGVEGDQICSYAETFGREIRRGAIWLLTMLKGSQAAVQIKAHVHFQDL